MAFAYVVFMKKLSPSLNPIDTSRIIEMAWEDRTPLEAIERLFNINPNQLVQFMRKELKAGSFKVWRKRMNGRQTKHLALRPQGVIRAYCKTQYKHK
ncbi:MAG: hypothetical protein ACI9C4_002177 [Paraglaciecola sp.]|jgi:uncharacterized protein (TIGR03643 family)